MTDSRTGQEYTEQHQVPCTDCDRTVNLPWAPEPDVTYRCLPCGFRHQDEQRHCSTCG